jgi:hypothetical protein
MFLGLPDPDPLVRDMDPDPNPSYHQAKIIRLLYDFLSLKNDVNVLSKSNKQKNFAKKIFLLTS